MAEHFLSADPTHSRWNRALAPHLTIDSGDTIHLECHDASGAQIRPGMTVEEFAQIDRNRIHALTGPVAISQRATRRRPTDRHPRNCAQRLGLVQRHRWPWLPQRTLHHAVPLPLATRKRSHALPRSGRGHASSFLWRNGRSARRGRRVPHPPSRPIRRQHGCSRTLRRRYALSPRLRYRRTLFYRRRPRRPRRRGSLHQRH